MSVREKSPQELADELDAIATVEGLSSDAPIEQQEPKQTGQSLVDVVEYVQPKPKKKEESPKQKLIPQPAPQPIPEVKEPKQEPQPPPAPIVESKQFEEEIPSLDGAIKSILADKDKEVDAKAVEEKKEFRHTINSGLAKLIEMAAKGSFALPSQPVQLPQEPQPSPIIKTETVVVKDNTEAIQRIDSMLIDPTVKNKTDLYKLKLQLQGKPFSESELAKSGFDSPVNPKKSDPTGFLTKRRIVALAIGIVAIIVIVVGLI